MSNSSVWMLGDRHVRQNKLSPGCPVQRPTTAVYSLYTYAVHQKEFVDGALGITGIKEVERKRQMREKVERLARRKANANGGRCWGDVVALHGPDSHFSLCTDRFFTLFFFRVLSACVRVRSY